VKLGEVADLNPKLPEAKIPKDESVVQFIPMKLVEEVSGRFHLTETRKYKEVKKGYTTFLDNDVLFAKVTPCMENGKIARVHGMLNGVGFGSTEFHVLRPTAAVDAKYLTHFVVQDRFRNEAERSMTGAVGLRRVPKQFIENHEIPLPPLATQQTIVAKIEELFSELDKGIESIKLAQQQLKTYRQSVLKAAFEGRLVGAQDFVPQQAGNCRRDGSG
jgi:type I restriction enzyme S subunit